MRSYGEPIDVRRGLVAGQEAPEQFSWRGRRWVVRELIAHWVETGAWWEQPGVAALLGVGAAGELDTSATDGGSQSRTSLAAAPLGADLLGERDLWRIEAGRRFGGGKGPEGVGGHGVFDLSFDWGSGQWHLVRSID
ncbi:MAG: hypothetical protein H0U28_02465 [Nocardioidaceae bacterium]|nr:hypothetical protein [Nocardioidaceae bacterium]